MAAAAAVTGVSVVRPVFSISEETKKKKKKQDASSSSLAKLHPDCQALKN